MLAASVADIDFLPALFGNLSLANSVHRYVTHTLLFAVVGGLAAFGVLKVLGKPRPLRSSLVLFACLIAHIFLDLLGKDYRPPIGVPFLWPFVKRSFALPVQIFPSLLKDTYAEIVSLHNIRVMAFEALLLGGLFGIVVGVKRRQGSRGQGSGVRERTRVSVQSVSPETRNPKPETCKSLDRLILSKTHDSIRVRCPAKVNLFLKVLGKRSDGYHDVQNVMQTLTLFDELSVRKQKEGVTLSCSGERIDGDAEENLVVRAANLFFRRGYGRPGVHLELKKNIPVAAGLGGGSSDAACCLLALNDLLATGLSNDTLREMAAELGSDVPFFIEGGTALCTGRGEVVKPLPAAPRLAGILASPDVCFKTSEMYSLLSAEDSHGPDVSEMLSSIASGDVSSLCSALFNSFERVAFQKAPELAALKSTLEKLGSTRVILCGSGPTLLGIFPTLAQAEAALQRFRLAAGPKTRFACCITSF
jgi:4-diphosphocytidyl-2-C-methyl-D-erythritol kinase